jgi:iron complex transport system substrate-binding protein
VLNIIILTRLNLKIMKSAFKPDSWVLVFGVLQLVFLFAACDHQSKVNEVNENSKQEITVNHYAEGFELYDLGLYKKLVINNPWQPGGILFSCYLIPDSIEPATPEAGAKIIRTPVRKAVCFSSTQWTGFYMLGGMDQVAGISEASYVVNSTVKERVAGGQIVEIAANGLIKNELLLNLQPDIILYTPAQTGYETILDQTKAGLIPWPDYFETDPLGRAEWIKVCGALLQQDALADSLFSAVESQYNQSKQLVAQLQDKPTIFADKQFSGQWFIPGGKSYVARLFADAGANYLWADNASKASFPTDIETVLSKAAEADFWRIAHAAPEGYSYKNLAEEYELYTRFKAFRERKVIFCNTSTSAYFEKGTYEPHLQLADLISCLHPELMHGYVPVYYRMLEDH